MIRFLNILVFVDIDVGFHVLQEFVVVTVNTDALHVEEVQL